MPNRFTAVPRRPVPPLAGRMGPLVTIADLFMSLMLSRPGGLSVRSAWVTPATLWLASLYTPAALILAVLLVVRGGWPSFLVAIALVVISLGSAAVVMVGAAQRRAPHR
ncbi:MAG TPA: hypothetical protein VIO13_06340 [Candidatus Dormibacteraeota bacterium]